jgi:hypothetical protein
MPHTVNDGVSQRFNECFKTGQSITEKTFAGKDRYLLKFVTKFGLMYLERRNIYSSAMVNSGSA